MSLEDRIRRLEQQFARLDVPSLEEVGAAFGRVTERAWARVRGEPSVPYEDRRKGDRDTIRRWAEGEGVDLDLRAEVWFEVHVHPLDPALLGHIHRPTHKPMTDSPTANIGVHCGIQYESMDTSVPGQVDEADQVISLEGADIAQALRQDRIEISPPMPRPRRREQVV